MKLEQTWPPNGRNYHVRLPPNHRAWKESAVAGLVGQETSLVDEVGALGPVGARYAAVVERATLDADGNALVTLSVASASPGEPE